MRRIWTRGQPFGSLMWTHWWGQPRQEFAFATLALLLTFLAPSPVSASSLRCSVGASVFVDGAPTASQTSTSCGNASANSSLTLLGSTDPTLSPAPLFRQSGAAIASAGAAFGTLSGSAETQAQAFPAAYFYTGSDGGAFAINNPYYAQSGANFFAGFQDRITIIDPTRSFGSPVTFDLSTNLIGTASSTAQTESAGFSTPSGVFIAFVNGARASGVFNLVDVRTGSTLANLQTNSINRPSDEKTVTLDVGFQYDIEGLLEGAAGSTAGSCSLGFCGPPGFYQMTMGDASFGDTAHFFLDPTSPGASYISDSGTTYFTPPAAAVPEPSSLFLMGTGLISLGRLAWTRHRRT